MNIVWFFAVFCIITSIKYIANVFLLCLNISMDDRTTSKTFVSNKKGHDFRLISWDKFRFLFGNQKIENLLNLAEKSWLLKIICLTLFQANMLYLDWFINISLEYTGLCSKSVFDNNSWLPCSFDCGANSSCYYDSSECL